MELCSQSTSGLYECLYLTVSVSRSKEDSGVTYWAWESLPCYQGEVASGQNPTSSTPGSPLSSQQASGSSFLEALRDPD